jgi:hypothetical protein
VSLDVCGRRRQFSHAVARAAANVPTAALTENRKYLKDVNERFPVARAKTF